MPVITFLSYLYLIYIIHKSSLLAKFGVGARVLSSATPRVAVWGGRGTVVRPWAVAWRSGEPSQNEAFKNRLKCEDSKRDDVHKQRTYYVIMICIIFTSYIFISYWYHIYLYHIISYLYHIHIIFILVSYSYNSPPVTNRIPGMFTKIIWDFTSRQVSNRRWKWKSIQLRPLTKQHAVDDATV